MSIVSLVKKTFDYATPPTGMQISQYSSEDYRGNDFWFWGKDCKEYLFSYEGHDSSLKAYKKCPPLTAIINKKAQAYINGKTWILNSRGNEATNDTANKLRKLLAKPNPLQTWLQFEAQQYIYEQIFGYCILLPIKPVGFKDNIDATSIWNIAPFMVDIEETKKLFYQSDTNGIIKQIVLNYKGTKTFLQASDIYIFKDFTPSFDSLIIPESRICSLEMPINNIIGAYESRNVLINYRGALGILTPEVTPSGALINEEHKEQLQQDFMRYGLKNNQWKFIISTAALKWQQMGVPTKDLMLFEEIEDDIMRICDSYNYPSMLLSNAKGTTFANLNEAKKLLYQDAIIPEAESIYEQWNIFFGLSDMNLKMDKDFSHVAALQEDDLKRAQSRKARNEALLIEFYNNLITLNRWLELNGEDPLTGVEGKMYYYQLVQKGWKFGGSPSSNQNNNNQIDNNNDQTA